MILTYFRANSNYIVRYLFGRKLQLQIAVVKGNDGLLLRFF